LLALALVANLVAITAPTAALALQRVGDERGSVAPAAWLPVAADAADRVEAALAAETVSAESRPIFAPIPAGWTARPTPSVPTPKPTTVKKGAAKSTTLVRSSGFHGRNHVWIPALGISRSTTGYSCSSSFYPGNRVYRWGCAGRNNVYLFGHAHSVFKPLHDAYVRGSLRNGMKVYYADGSGHVSTYAVRWWRLTTPENGAWAYAGQSRPTLTLQTCVGSRSQYRLIVRLTRV
jgi:hypothetical protein